MSLDCNCNYIGKLVTPVVNGKTYSAVGVGDIKVNTIVDGNHTTFVISYEPYVGIVASLTVTPEIVEVGSTFNAVYTSTWSKGIGVLDGEELDGSPYTTQVNGLIFYTVGVHAGKSLVVSDGVSSVERTTSIKAVHRYRLGRRTRSGEITLTDSKLGGSIQDAYGSLRSYEIGEEEQHIVWLVPVGETMGVVVDANGFTCETIGGDQMIVTNDYGVGVVYNVIYTKNFYPSGSILNLKF